jgi:hypothetical protein
MCPQETLVALTWEAIFDQFPSLIRDEIRGRYRTIPAIFWDTTIGQNLHTADAQKLAMSANPYVESDILHYLNALKQAA